jgi:protein involved in polysaccharide export with SLBB domain
MMRTLLRNRSFSFVTLLAVGLLICSAQLVVAQTGVSSEMLQKLEQLQNKEQPQKVEQTQKVEQPQSADNVTKDSTVSSPSRAEKFFSVPAPELGATFRGSSLIDEKSTAAGQAAGEQLIVPSVGRALKQFGYDFFANPKGSFVPDKMAPAGPDYMVGPGDRLLVSIWGSIEGNHETVVGRSGEIVLPKIGSISVWGQTFTEAKATIRNHIARYYTGFELSVTLAGLRSIQVFMVGEVAAPGTYTVSSLSKILTALVEAGGPAKTGSLRNIQLRRAGKLIDTVDFYDFLLNGDTSHDHTLQAGDTIFVPVIGPLVGVAGDVRRPAIYELRQGETLQAALNLAGGLNTTAFVGKVQIERVDAHTRRVVLDVDLNEPDALSLPIQDQDLVKVPSISPLTTSYVRLTGYASRPGQYQFSPGMRVADLILPYDNLLPMYYPEMAEILRLDPPEYRPRKLTIDLSLALAGDPGNNLELQEFDELRLFSRDEMEEVPEVQISGAVPKPGVYRLFEGMTVRDLVVASGNLREDAYLADAELTQYFEMGKETRIERLGVELGKAMQGDPEHNLQLRSGDHLLVRSIPEFHRKYRVQVEGKVLFPGTYTVTNGERLSSVLERAGGFSRGAYLRGSVFTRKSVEALVRDRMQKLIAQEEAAILNLSTELAQGAFNETDAMAAQNLLENRKQLVLKMKSAPVKGRVVVRLLPLEDLRNSEYDLELMDGDTVTIPETPSSVTVLGEVYNPTTIAYKQGRTASFYLSTVGGPNDNANEDEMFIVRADGSVYSKQQGGGGFGWDEEHNRWISGGFASVELYPGDTILVPQEFKKTDWMREVKDITLIMFQMALSAAAVASF